MIVRVRPARPLHLSDSATVVAALVTTTFLLGFGALHYGFFTKKLLLDTPLYERYGDRMVHRHQVPYRDFAVEYPPGALPVFAAPSVTASPGDFERYRRGFEVLMLLCGAAAAALVGLVLVAQRASQAQVLAGTALGGIAPLALGPVMLSRFDLWPGAVTVGALTAIVLGRQRLGQVLLGVGIAAKIYPGVLLPLTLVYVWKRSGRGEAGRCALLTIGAVAAFFAPFVALAPHGVWDSLHGQATRPLQIESLGASFLLAAHRLWGYGLVEEASHGSDNLVGALPDALASFQGLLLPTVVAALWIAFAYGPPTPERLLRYAAATVCAFVGLGRVLSPQYLIWLVALVPLVRGRRGWTATGLFLAAMVLTQLWFPHRYISLVYELDPRSSWLVLSRNLMLVALLLVLAWPERRRTAGIATVAPVVAAATLAAGAAAFAGPVLAGPMHANVLDLTGRASTCNTTAPPTTTSAGSAGYAIARFANDSTRARCVHVVLYAPRGVEAFAAAYLERFDPLRVRANHLGDAGTCTNLGGRASPMVKFGFVVPARSSFEVEIESCSSGVGRIPYAISVGTVGVPYRTASARRVAGSVKLHWHGGPAVVYREVDGRRIRAGSGSTAFVDEAAPLDDSLRYWLRVPAADELGWYGPAVP
jgi:hypothetical protein